MRPKDGLYHYKTGFPDVFNSNVGKVDLEYTMHAREEAERDRYGRIWLPKQLDTDKCTCIEVEYKLGYVHKIVYRKGYTNYLDVCFVVYLEQSHFVVGSVWCNKNSDTHKTLDVSRYNLVS